MYYTLEIHYPTHNAKYWRISKEEARTYINMFLNMVQANYEINKNVFANITSRPDVMPKILKFFFDNGKISIKRYNKEDHMAEQGQI